MRPEAHSHKAASRDACRELWRPSSYFLSPLIFTFFHCSRLSFSLLTQSRTKAGERLRRKTPQHKGSTVTPQHGNTRSMQAASGNIITSAMEARGYRRKGGQEKAGDGRTRENGLPMGGGYVCTRRINNVLVAKKIRKKATRGRREKKRPGCQIYEIASNPNGRRGGIAKRRTNLHTEQG